VTTAPVLADAATPAAATPPDQARFGALRTVVSWVLVVLVALLLPLSVVSLWSVRTLTDTNRYVTTMAPIIRDPVVTSYLAERTTDELFQAVNVEKIVADKVPGGALVAAPIVAQLHTYANKLILEILRSQTFATFWDRENRFTHSVAIKILSGNPDNTGKVANLEIKLRQLLLQAISQLAANGVTLFNPIVTYLKTHDGSNWVLMTASQLKTAQQVYHLATTLKWVLPAATIIFAALAVAVARKRRTTGVRLVVGALVGLALLAAGLAFAKHTFVSKAIGNPTVAAAIWSIVTRYLYDTVQTLFVLLLVVLALLWVFGPARWAQALRGQIRRGAHWVHDESTVLRGKAETSDTMRGASVAAGDNLGLLRGIGVAIALLVVVFAASTTAIIVTVVLLIAYLIGLQLLLSIGRSPAPLSAGSTPPAVAASVSASAPEEPADEHAEER